MRQENFGDSTDMCSLVNAKSGGCAEDCGFCAQSRYAEAATPIHAGDYCNGQRGWGKSHRCDAGPRR